MRWIQWFIHWFSEVGSTNQRLNLPRNVTAATTQDDERMASQTGNDPSEAGGRGSMSWYFWKPVQTMKECLAPSSQCRHFYSEKSFWSEAERWDTTLLTPESEASTSTTNWRKGSGLMRTGGEVKHLSSSMNNASASTVQKNRVLLTVEVGEAKDWSCLTVVGVDHSTRPAPSLDQSLPAHSQWCIPGEPVSSWWCVPPCWGKKT